MPRIIALSYPDPKLADYLKDQGYQVIDLDETSGKRSRVDVILYNTRHPGGISSHSRTEADLSVGYACFSCAEPPDTPTINITGLAPVQAIKLLETQLPRCNWHS